MMFLNVAFLWTQSTKEYQELHSNILTEHADIQPQLNAYDQVLSALHSLAMIHIQR